MFVMGISKVRLNGDTLMDVTTDTVASNNLLSGKTATGADGEKVNGGIAAKTSSDLTASGATVTAPAGYYASNASKSVASGTAGTPTASKGTVSNHAVTVTPSVTNTAGYISGGTKTGTGVSVTVAELESGTKTITENGTDISVSGYSAVDVDVAGSGGDEAEHLISGVHFVDFDGKVIESWKPNTVASKTALPSNPTHDGLTSQGWNWALADIKSYVAAHSDVLLTVGQMYITTSGATEIDIEIEEGRLTPYLGLGLSGTISIDWGDGTSAETVTGSSLSTQTRTPHTYAAAGLYTIKITKVSGTFYPLGTSTYSILSANSSTANRNRVYAAAVRRIRMGTGCNLFSSYACYYCTMLESVTTHNAMTGLGQYAFAYCYALKHFTAPTTLAGFNQYCFRECGLVSFAGNSSCNLYSSMFYICRSLDNVALIPSATSVTNYAFDSCYSLKKVVIPSTVTAINQGAFTACYSLSSVTVPSGVTDIGSSAFSNCYGLGEIHFKPTTPPTVAASNAFTNVPTDCVIYVPTGHLSDYTTGPDATYYPSSSTYTYVEE